MADYHIGYTLGYRIEKIRDKPQIIHRMENQQIGIAQKSQRRFGSVYHRKRITTVRILFLSDEQQKIPDAVIRSRLPPHQLRNDRIHATGRGGLFSYVCFFERILHPQQYVREDQKDENHIEITQQTAAGNIDTIRYDIERDHQQNPAPGDVAFEPADCIAQNNRNDRQTAQPQVIQFSYETRSETVSVRKTFG